MKPISLTVKDLITDNEKLTFLVGAGCSVDPPSCLPTGRSMIVGEIKYPNDYLVEVKADREMNFKDRLYEINVPTLILSGECDICYTVEDVQETAKGIPNSELILYKNYGHNLIKANRKQVQKDILTFLRKY